MKEKLKRFLIAYVKLVNDFVGAISIRRGSKKSMALAAGLTLALVVFLAKEWNLFLNPDTEFWGYQVYVVAFLFVAIIDFLIVFRVQVEPRYHNFFYTALFFLIPVVSIQMVECFQGNFIYVFSVPNFFMNYFSYMILYMFIYFICGRFRMTIGIANVLLFIFGMANYFIDLLRGTPLVPMDIFAMGTGMNVAAGYNYKLSWQIIMACLMFLIVMLLNRQMINIQPRLDRHKVAVRASALAYILLIVSLVFSTDVLADHGFKPDFWNQSRGYHHSGSWYNFCLNTKYIHVSEPDGYDSSNVNQVILETVAAEDPDVNNGATINLLTGEDNYVPTGEKPNIIAIMNETLSDPASLGYLQTTEDYLPFIHSMSENTIKGTVSVPVFGAGTSNSEYEFLTGNSISMLPAGSSVYESYITDAQPSLVSTLDAQGYSRTAFHPYFADGWNRPSVYQSLGFEKYISMSDLIDPEVVDAYQESNDENAFINAVETMYPDEDILCRRFVSDSYDFKKVTEMYENRDTSRPFFLFNVTMQNHGGYDRSYLNFYEDVHITSMLGYYPKAERYLSLLKQSDKAFEELIKYFSNVDEPTVILMFGDHQASIENAFYEELYGKSLDELSDAELQSRYHTPFVIWANYDIPEATVESISSNYLSTLLLQVAGLEMTGYNEYLAALYQEIPVIDSIGYKGRDGNYYDLADKNSPYASLMNGYSCVMYNNLLDRENREWTLFTLDTLPLTNPLMVQSLEEAASGKDQKKDEMPSKEAAETP